MDWGQVLTVLGANIGLFLWVRHESGEDRRQFLGLMKSIQDEMKDFHGRLVAIEERGKK